MRQWFNATLSRSLNMIHRHFEQLVKEEKLSADCKIVRRRRIDVSSCKLISTGHHTREPDWTQRVCAEVFRSTMQTSGLEC